MSTMTALVEEFVKLRSERLELEHKAEEIKNGRERETKEAILQAMMSQGLKSANVEGFGKVVRKETSHFEIASIDSLCYAMFKNMVQAAQEGRPLSDALLFQRRVHSENLGNYLEGLSVESEAEMASIGVRKAIRYDLSFTKA